MYALKEGSKFTDEVGTNNISMFAFFFYRKHRFMQKVGIYKRKKIKFIYYNPPIPAATCAARVIR